MIPRYWKNVSQHDSPLKEPRQDRMRESHGRVILQTLLRNAIHTAGFWIDLPRWRRLGEENYIQGSPNHHLPMDLLQYLPPRQEKRGYLRRQGMKEMMGTIKTLLDTRPDEIPKDSQFLLDINHRKLA